MSRNKCCNSLKGENSHQKHRFRFHHFRTAMLLPFCISSCVVLAETSFFRPLSALHTLNIVGFVSLYTLHVIQSHHAISLTMRHYT